MVLENFFGGDTFHDGYYLCATIVGNRLNQKMNMTFIYPYFYIVRPLKNGPFWSISASDSNFNPRNIQYIPAYPVGPRKKPGRGRWQIELG